MRFIICYIFYYFYINLFEKILKNYYDILDYFSDICYNVVVEKIGGKQKMIVKCLKNLVACGCGVVAKAGDLLECIKFNTRFYYVKVLNGITYQANKSEVEKVK